MADDKTSEIDDWLKDLDEPDIKADSASEKEIESLLADKAADEEAPQDQSAIDSLFDDEAPGKKETASSSPVAGKDDADGGGLIDQSDIDSLFGNDADEEKKESAPEAAESTSEGDLLDQSDIDSLFGDSDTDSPKAAAEEPEDEAGLLDQSDIDSLFSDSKAEPKTAVKESKSPAGSSAAEESDTPDDFSELDQSDIDSLFGDSKTESALAADSAPPSQDEIDQMFAERGKGKNKETAGDDDAFATPGGNAFDFFGEDAAFDEDASDIPDIPDLSDDSSGQSTLDHEEERTLAGDIFNADDESKELTAALAAKTQVDSDPTRRIKNSFVMPAFLSGGMKWVSLGVVLSLAAVGAGLYFTAPWKKQPQPAIEVAGKETAGQEEAAPLTPAVNTAPNVGDVALLMGETPGAISFTLSGEDPEGDALQFVVTDPPQFGRLSGDPPELTYLPTSTFPGCDQFVYRASDGKDVSASATVVITGPDLRQAKTEDPPAEVKTISPEQPMIAAKDITLRTESTRDLRINWKSIWEGSNKTPFGKSVSVEVYGKPQFGTLKKSGGSQHIYRPVPYQSGTITLAYRFRKGGLSSKKKALRLVVETGDPRPEIKLRPLADAYNVGETVVLDASATRDDHPATLMFSWEQVDGVPVKIKPLNQAASAVTFVTPATFYTANYPEPVIKLTAIDQTGQSDTVEIRVKTKTRRRSALWNMEASTGGGTEGSALWTDPR